MADVDVTLSLPVLRKGMGDDCPSTVQDLQIILNTRGGTPHLAVDGQFGRLTEKSLKHWQRNENITADGIVGQETWTALLSAWLLRSEPG